MSCGRRPWVGTSYHRQRRHLDGSDQTFSATAPLYETPGRRSRVQERAAAPDADRTEAAVTYGVNFHEDGAAIGRIRRNGGVCWLRGVLLSVRGTVFDCLFERRSGAARRPTRTLAVSAATFVRARLSLGCSTGRPPVATTTADGQPLRALKAAATAAPSPAVVAAATP